MKMPIMPDDTASAGVLSGTMAPPEVDQVNHSEEEGEVKES